MYLSLINEDAHSIGFRGFNQPLQGHTDSPSALAPLEDSEGDGQGYLWGVLPSTKGASGVHFPRPAGHPAPPQGLQFIH